jgi:hypothetical protein
MTAKPSKRAAEASPGPAAAKSCPTMPLAPVAAGQGDRSPSLPVSPETAAKGSPQTPGLAVGGEPAASPGTSLAETQKRQLAQIKAARSALAKERRNRRARPWQGRDPLRNAVPGVRVMPPPKDGA